MDTRAAGYDAHTVVSNHEWFLREITLDERGALDLMRRVGYDVMLPNATFYVPDYAIFDPMLPHSQKKLAVLFDSYAEFGAWRSSDIQK
jgi:hypothetical protein